MGSEIHPLLSALTGLLGVNTLLQSVLLKPVTSIAICLCQFYQLECKNFQLSIIGDDTMIDIANKRKPVEIPHIGYY